MSKEIALKNKRVLLSLGVVIAALRLMIPALAASAGSSVRNQPMPSILRVGEPSENRLLWVDADHVLTPDGKLNTANLSQVAAIVLPPLLKLPETDGCVRLGQVVRDTIDFNGKLVQRTSLESAVRSAGIALLAKVVGRSYGFKGGEAGQLLRLEPETILKDTLKAQPEYFVFLPVGEFRVGTKRYCKTDPSYPPPPDLGDEVLVFVLDGYRADVRYLDIIDPAGLITIRKDGSVTLPPSYRTSVAASHGREVIERVRALAKEDRR